MIEHLNWVATYVFVAFFVLVTVMGFVAARWRAGDLDQLHEWGLGGRRFGAWISWFLIGGDLYTAYTVIAVPALVYAVGAYGFFAVALYHHHLSLAVRRLPAPVVGDAQARLSDGRRLRPGPVRQQVAGAGYSVDRYPCHHALHRAAAGRHRESHPGAWLFG